MSETRPYHPSDVEPSREQPDLNRIRDHYVGTKPIEDVRELQRVLRRWRDTNRQGVFWPETDYRIMQRLYERSRNVWEVLSNFSGSFRFPRNEDGQLSRLIPQAVWDDAKRAYGHYEKEILALEANRPHDFDERLENYRTEKIPKLLTVFHDVADPYIVAEGQLAFRHLDLFTRVLRNVFLDENGTALTSEDHAVTLAKELMTKLFPDEYEQILDAAIATETQRMNPDEFTALVSAYRPVFKEMKRLHD